MDQNFKVPSERGEARKGAMSSQSEHLCISDSVCIHVGVHIYRARPQVMVTSWHKTGAGQSTLSQKYLEILYLTTGKTTTPTVNIIPTAYVGSNMGSLCG